MKSQQQREVSVKPAGIWQHQTGLLNPRSTVWDGCSPIGAVFAPAAVCGRAWAARAARWDGQAGRRVGLGFGHSVTSAFVLRPLEVQAVPCWLCKNCGWETRGSPVNDCLLVCLSEEDEKHEKLRLEREQEQRKASVPRANHAVPPEEPRGELLVPISPPAPAPPPPPPLAAPISVIPIPVVTSPPQPAAQAALSPPLAQRHPPLVSTPGITKEPSSVAPVIQRPPGALLPDGKAGTPPAGSPKQLQHYAAPVLAISQHHVVPQPIQPQPMPHPAPPLGALKLAPAEDVKPSEQKKRPGG